MAWLYGREGTRSRRWRKNSRPMVGRVVGQTRVRPHAIAAALASWSAADETRVYLKLSYFKLR